jgi:HEAT repeat protein
MLAVCINCWREMESESRRCPRCGTNVDSESHSYERLLFWALKNSQPEHRAEVCKILGLHRRKEAVAHLVEAINDRATIVRIAALGALGRIADESSRSVVEKAQDCESLEVQIAAQRALEQIEAARNQSSSIHASESRSSDPAPHVG